jgi:serine/threonine protein kinase, bacterial
LAGSLTEVSRIDREIEAYLTEKGEIFRAFRRQDSGCISYGVDTGEQRWFVKYSQELGGIESLQRARKIYSTVRHPALPQIHNSFEIPHGLALVLDWLPGENLYDYTAARGLTARQDPSGPHARFRALPVRQILAALDTIYDAHLAIAESGFIAVDFYDGCILYDFQQARTHLCDLDEYRTGPFTNAAERLPGSRRFMAPEEFHRGARIDQATNVFTLARAALELLGDGSASLQSWRGSPAMLDVLARATQPEREGRCQSVADFVEGWRRAVSESDLGI